MKSRSLLAQVLAVNLLLVAGTVLVAAIALDTHLSLIVRGREAMVLGLAFVATLLGNWLLLRRRFEPLDQLISAMETTDLAGPQTPRLPGHRSDSAEVQRLEVAFGRMVSRLEAERRHAGKAAIEAQERERRRIAQDLHDEVNQALTAVSLRLQASIEQAPEELRKELLGARVLTPSMHDDERYLFEALKAGASGYVLKREADQDLVGGVRAAGRGEAFLTNAAERSIIRVDGGWLVGTRDRADPTRGGGGQAARRSAHERPDRRDSPPGGEDGGVPSRECAAQAGDA